MRFEVERDVFIAALKKSGRLRSPASLVPNLDKVLVVATPDQIQLLTTNLTQILRIDVPSADVSEEGTAVFPRPSEVAQFLSSLPDGPVLFDSSNDALTMSSGKTKSTRQLVAVKTYPSLPDLDIIKDWHKIPAGLFAQDLAAASPLALKAETAHFAQVKVEDGVFYGSDGLHAHAQQTSGYECPDISVSASAVPLLKSLVLTSEVEYVSVGLAKTAVLFSVPDITLLTYNPTVEMPDVKSSIISVALENDQILEVDRDELKRAVLQVSGTTDNFSAVRIFAAKSGEIVLKSKSASGQTETSISGEFNHKDQEVILSVGSLIRALDCYAQQSCTLLLGPDINKSGAKSISPVRLSANDGEVGKFVAVLTQLRKDIL